MISDATWKCSRGERVDQIAFAVYGDAKKAAEILCMNPGMEKLVFDGGEVLDLPIIESDANEVTEAPWRT